MDKIKSQLNKNGFTFKKAFGQNFITDDALLDEIVDKSGVTKSDTVIEIGCGAGTLTKALSRKAKRVIGYEIDKRLQPILEENLSGADNVKIIFNDILKEKIEDTESRIGEEYTVVANLPYYITTPIVMTFLEQAKKLKSMVIMVQEEVADRFSASPSCSDYGAITVGINLRGSAKTVMKVNRKYFTPIPNVDSAVVKIDIDNAKFQNVDKEGIRDLVRIAFSMRRKTLVNNLMKGYNISREKAVELLQKADISETERGENLSAEQYVKLYEIINNK